MQRFQKERARVSDSGWATSQHDLKLGIRLGETWAICVRGKPGEME